MIATRLRNLTRGTELSDEVYRTQTYLDRVVGALHYRTIKVNQGIWIEPCFAVHTFGMRSTIDVILLDSSRRVIALRPSILPNSSIIGHFRARAILEMGVGFLQSVTIRIGDHLTIENDTQTETVRQTADAQTY